MEIGIDIEKVSRISKLIRNRRFLSRVFSGEEVKYCRAKKNSVQHFTVRFAAKEAVWKALSAVNKNPLSHKNISVKNNPDGKPVVILPPELKAFQKKISISLSHTREYAVAIAVLS